jgi:2',3'-cyclic-nucleotide 2'-phosphodiesterase (5'-nucleotidase family)
VLPQGSMRPNHYQIYLESMQSRNTILKFAQRLVWVYTLLFLVSCKTQVLVKEDIRPYVKLESSLPADSQVIAMVSPYKAQLDQEMNKVLAQTSVKLVKAAPERSLGYFMCDAVYAYLLQRNPVDLVLVNNGGIRIPSIQVGDISVGKVYELMPFDNTLVIIELNGQQLQVFLNHVATKDGWPVNEGCSYTLQEGQASNVMIAGQALDPQKMYKIGVSDYVANGGDDCTMLKDLPRIETGVMVRDALIEYLRGVGNAGQTVRMPRGDRVRNQQ